MKKTKLIIFFALSIFTFYSCANTKKEVDMLKYKGVILIDRSTDWSITAPVGAHVHTFRLKDSVWSESYMYGCFANFELGDTLK